MESSWIEGIGLLLNPQNLLTVLVGTVLGLIVGVVPGIGSLQAVALLLPATFSLRPDQALALLGAVGSASVYGGAITSVVLNTPGDPTSAATVLDGYPLARQGKAGLAIGAASFVSMLGGLAGVCLLIWAAPPLARLALGFGPPEFFLLGGLGLLTIAAVIQADFHKGLLSAGLGILLSTIGFSPILGIPRFTLGTVSLQDGISFVALTVGLFTVAEALDILDRGGSISSERVLGRFWEGVGAVFRYPVTVVRSVLIGLLVGILPGVGATAANILSYAAAVRASRHPERFGKGEVEGVIAAEASNNAVVGAALIPTLTLGIPGSALAALMLGALTIHGLRPGPRLFVEQAPLVYSFFGSLFLAQVTFFVLGMLFHKPLAQVTRVPARFLALIMIVLAVFAAFAERFSLTDVAIVVLLGVGAYYFRRFGCSPVATIIAFVLGPIVEESFTQTMLMSGGSWGIFFSRSISLWLLLVGAAVLMGKLLWYPLTRRSRAQLAAR